MTTAIAVTSKGHMLPSPERHTPRAHVFQAPEEQSFDVALAEAERLIEQHGHLVVVHPVGLPRPFLHRLHAIRSVLESDRIALLPTSLPPLGTAVLVRQLRQLSLCEFSPGVLGASVRLLAHYIYAGALLNSVAKLDHLPSSLTANAKSWNPRAQYAVLAAPTPQLVRTDNGASGDAAGARATLAGPQFATHLTVAHGQSASTWVSASLAPQWRVGEVHEVYLPEESARWWGTGRIIEFAAAIPDVSVLYRLVSSVRRDECHWCGLELIGDRCAFCAAPAPYGTGARRVPARRAVEQGQGQGPVQGRDAVQGSGSQDPVQNPAQNQVQSPVHGQVQNPAQNQVQSPVHGQVQNPAQSPVHGKVQNPVQSPVQEPGSGSASGPSAQGSASARDAAPGSTDASALRPATGTGPAPAGGPANGPADPRTHDPRTHGSRTDGPRRSNSGLAAFLKQKHAAAAAKEAAARADAQSRPADAQSRHAVVADPRGL